MKVLCKCGGPTTKAIAEEDCQIVRDLHDEGLSDWMIAIRFDTTEEHVKNIYTDDSY